MHIALQLTLNLEVPSEQEKSLQYWDAKALGIKVRDIKSPLCW